LTVKKNMCVKQNSDLVKWLGIRGCNLSSTRLHFLAQN